MKQDKEIPIEYVSIRTIWLQGINDCRRAIGARAIQETTYERQEQNVGDRTIVYTVDAFAASLCDYGEATLRTDVDHYKNTIIEPAIKKIWDSWFEEQKVTEFAGMPGETKKKGRSYGECWRDHARLSIRLFDFIIQTMNKYGMLFEKPPEGWSNVEMSSVETGAVE